MGRKLLCDQSLFERWTSEEAWLAGLLWADGGLCREGNYYRIALNTVDKELAQHFTRIAGDIHIGVKAPVGVRKAVYRVNIAGAPVRRLMNIGLTERKSFTAEYPQVKHERHFIRGYFDGDGTVFENSAQGYSYVMSAFIGSVPFIEVLNLRLARLLKINPKRLLVEECGVARLLFSVRDTERLGQYMYSRGGPCLSRKQAKFGWL